MFIDENWSYLRECTADPLFEFDIAKAEDIWLHFGFNSRIKYDPARGLRINSSFPHLPNDQVPQKDRFNWPKEPDPDIAWLETGESDLAQTTCKYSVTMLD